MNMNRQEEKALHRVAKKHAAWLKWGRYLCLIFGATGVVAFIWKLAVIDWSVAEEMGSGFASMMAVQIYVLGGICILMLGKALFQWHGDPRDILLLKLLNDSAERKDAASPRAERTA